MWNIKTDEELLFNKVKDTISESKSQLISDKGTNRDGCLIKSKIQFLKANHNVTDNVIVNDIVV